jgi:hypothetical protein
MEWGYNGNALAMNAKLIKIDLTSTGRGETALWHVTTPDLPGIRLTNPSRAEVLASVCDALEAYCPGWKAHQVEWKRTDELYYVLTPPPKCEQAA